MYKPDIPSGGSLSSLPIYAEVNKKKTRFAPDPTPISRNPDPIQSDLSLQDRSKSDFYNRKIGGSAYNLNLAPNQEMGSTNGNAGGGASVKRRNSTKRASLTESFKKFVDKLRHGESIIYWVILIKKWCDRSDIGEFIFTVHQYNLISSYKIK